MKTGSPLNFDFTTLSNYIHPANTLEAENETWIEAKSTFHVLEEFHIFTYACKRRSPSEIEIKRIPHRLTDWQFDALHTYFSDLGIPLDKKETEWIESKQPLIAFCHSSITNKRGLAVVLDNNLHFIS